MESQLKLFEKTAKEKQILEGKCRAFEDQIKDLKSDLESAVTNASQSEGVVNLNFANERRRHRQNIEVLKKDHEQEKKNVRKEI